MVNFLLFLKVQEQLKIPITSIGTGERKEDLVDFKAKEFSDALLDLN